MTYEIHWRNAALRAAGQFMADDSAALLQVFDSVDLLAEEPRPKGSTTYGSDDIRRIRIGRYRVIYEIEDAAITIAVMHLGRTA